MHQVVKTTEYYDDRDNDSTIWYKHLVPHYRRIPDQDIPKDAKLGFQFESTTVNPEKLLPWLKRKLEARGVRFIQQNVKRIEDVKNSTGCKVIINASGLGAYDLASDNAVVPARGQTMFVKTDCNELKMWQGSHYTYVIPRMGTGGVIVGGISQEGNFDREIDQSLRPDILNRVKMLAGGSLDAVDLERDVQRDIVAFRPGRRGGYRLETEGDVIHAYGFGSLGYIYSYGVGLKVRDLVQSVASTIFQQQVLSQGKGEIPRTCPVLVIMSWKITGNDHHIVASLRESEGRHQPNDACSDDCDVHFSEKRG